MNGAAGTLGRVVLAGVGPAVRRLEALAQGRGWQVTSLSSSREVLRFLRTDPAVDLVVLATNGELQADLEVCRTVKFDKRTHFVSVVVVLPPGQALSTPEVLEGGADDCVLAEADEREIGLRLQRAVRLKRATDSLDDAEAVITSLANAIEGKDHYTCGHVERVGAYCLEIGRRVGVDAEGMQALRVGGVVHDIGKVGIPDQILNKPGRLTEEEMAVMRRHPLIGYDILKPLRTFRHVLPIVRWHHEKVNGKGYPDGLAGDAVPLLARITAVADVFDALTTDRPYRKAFPIDKCRSILGEMGANGDLDAGLVDVLFEALGQQLAPAEPPAA